jgi:NAD(P)-dependent dehydrogenase (short-subunit alcohol dehydrogenase family)
MRGHQETMAVATRANVAVTTAIVCRASHARGHGGKALGRAGRTARGYRQARCSAEAIPAAKAQFVKQVPLGRIATPDEIARWVVAISEPTVTWVTGQVLSIDGGMSLT